MHINLEKLIYIIFYVLKIVLAALLCFAYSKSWVIYTYLWFIVLQVLFGLTDKELEVLDDFEDTEYTRQVVEPIVMVLATCTFYSSWISYYNISPPRQVLAL